MACQPANHLQEKLKIKNNNKMTMTINVTVTVTKVFILRFLLKDRKRITQSFTYIQRILS